MLRLGGPSVPLLRSHEQGGVSSVSFPLQTVKGTSPTRGVLKGASDRFEHRQSKQPYPEHVPPGLQEVKRERVSPSVTYRAGAANSERRDKHSSLSPPRRPGQAALPS